MDPFAGGPFFILRLSASLLVRAVCLRLAGGFPDAPVHLLDPSGYCRERRHLRSLLLPGLVNHCSHVGSRGCGDGRGCGGFVVLLFLVIVAACEGHANDCSARSADEGRSADDQRDLPHGHCRSCGIHKTASLKKCVNTSP